MSASSPSSRLVVVSLSALESTASAAASPPTSSAAAFDDVTSGPSSCACATLIGGSKLQSVTVDEFSSKPLERELLRDRPAAAAAASIT